jgi:4-hydroxy-3-polyprenylbenzoate decarboxylase
MLKLQQMGVRAFPISPAFYGNPKTLNELVDFVVGKIFDLMGVDNDIYNRWGEG